VPHLHVHIIPRYEGDVADPRGGIRNVVPDQSGYLEMIPIPSSGRSL
jgi:diadenosine tetraphosphate (Ap4A) HIT family hydrolase